MSNSKRAISQLLGLDVQVGDRWDNVMPGTVVRVVGFEIGTRPPRGGDVGRNYVLVHILTEIDRSIGSTGLPAFVCGRLVERKPLAEA